MSLDLIEVMAADVDIHCILYRWDQEETHRDQYTCRPVPTLPAWDVFMESIAHRLQSDALRVFVLWDTTMKAPLGRVTTFDHNPRNRSAEFGYYLPPVHRQQGHARAMVQRFLTKVCRQRVATAQGVCGDGLWERPLDSLIGRAGVPFGRGDARALLASHRSTGSTVLLAARTRVEATLAYIRGRMSRMPISSRRADLACQTTDVVRTHRPRSSMKRWSTGCCWVRPRPRGGSYPSSMRFSHTLSPG